MFCGLLEDAVGGWTFYCLNLWPAPGRYMGSISVKNAASRVFKIKGIYSTFMAQIKFLVYFDIKVHQFCHFSVCAPGSRKI